MLQHPSEQLDSARSRWLKLPRAPLQQAKHPGISSVWLHTVLCFVGTAMSARHRWTGCSVVTGNEKTEAEGPGTNERSLHSLKYFVINACNQKGKGALCNVTFHGFPPLPMSACVQRSSSLSQELKDPETERRQVWQTPPFTITSVLFTLDTSSDNTDKAALWLFVWRSGYSGFTLMGEQTN